MRWLASGEETAKFSFLDYQCWMEVMSSRPSTTYRLRVLADLMDYLASHTGIGAVVSLTIICGSQEMTVDVRSQERPPMR
jgi:hypothetical protein